VGDLARGADGTAGLGAAAWRARRRRLVSAGKVQARTEADGVHPAWQGPASAEWRPYGRAGMAAHRGAVSMWLAEKIGGAKRGVSMPRSPLGVGWTDRPAGDVDDPSGARTGSNSLSPTSGLLTARLTTRETAALRRPPATRRGRPIINGEWAWSMARTPASATAAKTGDQSTGAQQSQRQQVADSLSRFKINKRHHRLM